MASHFLTMGTMSVTVFFASFDPLRRAFLPLSCHLRGGMDCSFSMKENSKKNVSSESSIFSMGILPRFSLVAFL